MKCNQQWIWLAIDRSTREIIGVHVSDRNREGTQSLWDSIPEFTVNRQHSILIFGKLIKVCFQKNRHHAVGKETGQTNHIERFNCTLRQRIARLVRKTLSFSKKT